MTTTNHGIIIKRKKKRRKQWVDSISYIHWISVEKKGKRKSL